MSALNPEQTIHQVIGQVVVIPAYSSLEAALRGAVKELDENYYLQTAEEFIRGPLIKYGILDVTFQNRKTKRFLKIYGEADNVGYVSHIKKPEKSLILTKCERTCSVALRT
jgi:hypothetical protein